MLSEKSISLPHVSILNENKTEKATHPQRKPTCGCIIVFGRDDKGKAHASRFDEDARASAMRAAYRMGFVALAVTRKAMRNIAEDLPEGRVFKSGKAFVPFVKSGVCIALEGHAKQFPRDVLELSHKQIAEIDAEVAKEKADADEFDAYAGAGDQSSDNDDVTDHKAGDANDTSADDNDDDSPVKSNPQAGWADVEVGTTVLAVDDPDDGWWEAKFTHAHKSGIGRNTITMLTLEWVLYPDEPSFVRRANEVAYFPAAYGQQAPIDKTGRSGAAS